MSGSKRAVAYHGISNVKFAPKSQGTYATDFIPIAYATALGLTAKLEGAELFADNRLVCRVPSDQGYDGEIGTTSPCPALEKAAGYALDGASGIVGTNVTSYLRGALYYEFIETDADGQNSTVKAWMLNVEIGKGSENHATDTNTVQFGSYSYPYTCYGDTLKAADGTADYVDANGMGRLAFTYTARPDDEGYATFGSSVPVPKVAAVAEGV